MLVIYLAPLPRGFFLGTLGPFRFSLSGPMLRPRLRNLANEPLEAWPCIGLEFNFARLRFWSVGHGAGMIKPLDHDAHERERRTMHDNVVRCILNWAHLEDELAWLLHLILDSALNQVGMIIYHAPNNTETRIRIVDKVVSRDLELLIGGELIEPSWRSIVKLVSEAKVRSSCFLPDASKNSFMNCSRMRW